MGIAHWWEVALQGVCPVSSFALVLHWTLVLRCLARQFSHSAVPQPDCAVFAMGWDWGALGEPMGYRVHGWAPM